MNTNAKKDIAKITEALEKATYVSNDLELKTEIKKKTIAIISTDTKLYEKLLKKFPKEKVAEKSKKAGKFLTISGLLITLLTGGVLAIVGLPMAGAGAAIGVTGLALEDYKDYTLFMDYEKNQVIFLKTKGTPSIKLSRKFNKVVDNYS